MSSDIDPDDEVFDPGKGYTVLIPTSSEEAINAFYQGFITEYEHKALLCGKALINYRSELVWLFEDRPKRLLNRARMLEIKGDALMGFSDGTTTIR